MSPDTKSILQSKGVWGAVAVLIAQAISAALHLDPSQASEVLNLSTQTIQVGLQAITVIGAITALYGRITATKRLLVKPVAITKEN